MAVEVFSVSKTCKEVSDVPGTLTVSRNTVNGLCVCKTHTGAVGLFLCTKVGSSSSSEG